MAKIAVDIVLLPCDEMTDKAILANKQLLKTSDKKIVLNKNNCLPHISLTMGCINQQDIPAIENILKTIAPKYLPLKLRVLDIHVAANAIGQKVSSFQIEKIKTIQSLHEQIMKDLLPFFTYDVTADMLATQTQVAESTLLWIKNFPTNSSYENFFPHITLGYGQIKLNKSKLPQIFTAPTLALCHLGNHCTCQKILAATKLDA